MKTRRSAQAAIAIPLGSSPAEADVRNCVKSLLLAACGTSAIAERRRDRRYPYPHLVHVTPATDDGLTAGGETVVVVGKHLSERGLGFFHQQPLSCRRMIVSLEATPGQWVGLLIDLTWCRFTKHGWYESGGRFLQLVPPRRREVCPAPKPDAA